ncbi:MAG: hypothetical protein OXF86_02620 [Caldilineaceae bacterium]|nr:hypothetical protein [Caldilineaceae bacterium]
MEMDAEEQRQGDFLFGARIVPVGREGNKVFVRTLRHGEEDASETVRLRLGDRILFRAGDLIIDSRQIDAMSPKGPGGYAPVANTVWTWYRIASERADFLFFFFALARRLDAAHALWALAIEERDQANEEGGIPQRSGFLKTLATAEMAIVALNRAFNMANTLTKEYCPDLELPATVQKIQGTVSEMRNAFEHIGDRAQGKVNRTKISYKDAWSIFNQPDFIEKSTLRYQEHSLQFDRDVIDALLDCRELIMQAIDSRAALHARNGRRQAEGDNA